MMGMGYTEMLLFGAVALLLFGGKLPEVARSLGQTYRELKKNVNEFQREFQGLTQIDSPPPRNSSGNTSGNRSKSDGVYESLDSAMSDTDSPTSSASKELKAVTPRFTPPPADDE